MTAIISFLLRRWIAGGSLSLFLAGFVLMFQDRLRGFATVVGYPGERISFENVGIALCCVAFLYFFLAVAVLPAVPAPETLAPTEFLLRILVSAGLTVVSHAILFSGDQLRVPQGDGRGPASGLYFALVTFSTLGYGDFTPQPALRLWAAFLAIQGNLHLGLFVAAAYYLLQSDPPRGGPLPVAPAREPEDTEEAEPGRVTEDLQASGATEDAGRTS